LLLMTRFIKMRRTGALYSPMVEAFFAENGEKVP